MVNAYEAGTIVAVTAAGVGWFMVLRRQTFAGHTLAMVAFPGAAAATLLGVSVGFGYYGFCLAAALIIAVAPRGSAALGGFSQESAVIGTVQAFALASGFLFVALYHGFLEGVNALLFGTFLGITDGQVLTLLVVAVSVVTVMALIGRPLLFASIDPARRRCTRGAGEAARRGVSGAARPGRRRRYADHRSVARLRPARHAGGHGAATDGPARSQPRPLGGHRTRRDLGRTRPCLLLALPTRLLGDQPGLRALCAGRPCDRAAAARLPTGGAGAA